jgi:hypothetical protein
MESGCLLSLRIESSDICETDAWHGGELARQYVSKQINRMQSLGNNEQELNTIIN